MKVAGRRVEMIIDMTTLAFYFVIGFLWGALCEYAVHLKGKSCSPSVMLALVFFWPVTIVWPFLKISWNKFRSQQNDKDIFG